MHYRRHEYPHAAIHLLVGLLMLGALSGATADEPDRKADNSSNGRAATEDSKGESSKTDDDSSPELGLFVVDCPGDGVCVAGTIWGSPADEAEIRSGDYIVAVDGTPIDSTARLRELVEAKSAGERIRLKTWRGGEEIEKEVTLAAESKQMPAGKRTWLGVVLEADAETGLRVDQVYPDSPASKAGLQSGDIITQAEGKPLKTVEAFIESIESSEPGSELTLTIRRDEDEKHIVATLGDADQAPSAWLRRAFRPPLEMEEMDEFVPWPEAMPDPIDHLLDDLRAQIRSLQEAVNQLQRRSEPANGKKKSSDAKAEADSPTSENNSDRDDTSSNTFSSNPTAQPTMLIDVGDRRVGPRSNLDRFQSWTRRGDEPRYRARDFRYRPSFPPGYRYQYYRYGGRPFYVPGTFWYGPRYGLRYGPVWRYYWH